MLQGLRHGNAPFLLQPGAGEMQGEDAFADHGLLQPGGGREKHRVKTTRKKTSFMNPAETDLDPALALLSTAHIQNPPLG